MSFNWPKSGNNHVPSYQISGIPFVTSSVVNEAPSKGADSYAKVAFPFVTRFFVVKCPTTVGGVATADNLRVAFSANGLIEPTGSYSASGNNRNYFIVMEGKETPRFEMRCKELFFCGDGIQGTGKSSFEVIAGLTTIESSQFFGLTGSNGFEGVG